MLPQKFLLLENEKFQQNLNFFAQNREVTGGVPDSGGHYEKKLEEEKLDIIQQQQIFHANYHKKLKEKSKTKSLYTKRKQFDSSIKSNYLYDSLAKSYEPSNYFLDINASLTDKLLFDNKILPADKTVSINEQLHKELSPKLDHSLLLAKMPNTTEIYSQSIPGTNSTLDEPQTNGSPHPPVSPIVNPISTSPMLSLPTSVTSTTASSNSNSPTHSITTASNLINPPNRTPPAMYSSPPNPITSLSGGSVSLTPPPLPLSSGVLAPPHHHPLLGYMHHGSNKIVSRNLNGTLSVTQLPVQGSEIALYRVLQRANLLGYYDAFICQGGDDVQQLCEAGEEEFLEIMALVGMASKPLHVRRLQKALQEWVANPREFMSIERSSVNSLLNSIAGGNTTRSHLSRNIVEPLLSIEPRNSAGFYLRNSSSSPDSSSKTLSVDSDSNFDACSYKDNRQTVIKEIVPCLDQSVKNYRRSSPDIDLLSNDISRHKFHSELSDKFHGVTVKEEPDLTVLSDHKTAFPPITIEQFNARSQISNSITTNNNVQQIKGLIRNGSPRHFNNGQHPESFVKNNLNDSSFPENLKTKPVLLCESIGNFKDRHSTRYSQTELVNDRLGMGVNYIGQPMISSHRCDESTQYRIRRREHVITSKDCKESTNEKTDWSQYKIAGDSSAGKRNVRVENISLGTSNTVKRRRSSDHEESLSPGSRQRSAQPPGLSDTNQENKSSPEELSLFKFIGHFMTTKRND